MKIGFIGFGNMARSIAMGLNSPEFELYAAAPSLPNGANAQGVHTYSSNLKVVEKVDIIILSVKPKHISEVWEEIHDKISPHQLIITIAAGINLTWFEKRNAHLAIIRAMPNIAVAVGQGVTTLFAGAHTTAEQRQCAEHIFSNSGITSWLRTESEIDICTALSGSGPAYIFLFMDAMIQAAKRLGLEEETAKKLTLHTFQGASTLAQRCNSSLMELKKQVTSPGGTTAAALEILEQTTISDIIDTAIKAAYERARQLARS